MKPWKKMFSRSAPNKARDSPANDPSPVNPHPLLSPSAQKSSGQASQQAQSSVGWSRPAQSNTERTKQHGPANTSPHVSSLAKSFSQREPSSIVNNPVKRNQSLANTQKVTVPANKQTVNNSFSQPSAAVKPIQKFPDKKNSPKLSWPKPPPVDAENGQNSNVFKRTAPTFKKESNVPLSPVRHAPSAPAGVSKFEDVPLSPVRAAPGPPSVGGIFSRKLPSDKPPPLPARSSGPTSQSQTHGLSSSPSIAERARMLNQKLANRSSPSESRKT